MEIWMLVLPAVLCIGLYLLCFRGIAVTKCMTAMIFMFWPGKDSDKTTVDSCDGWVRHVGRFRESRTYEFVLYSEMSKGNVEVFLLDQEKQPLLRLTPWLPSGSITMDGNSRYYLQWNFISDTGRFELRW